MQEHISKHQKPTHEERDLNNEHLCESCLDEFPTCNTENIVFGIDRDISTAFTKDADRVLECSSYMNRLPDIPDGGKR
jgi:hypothetical protein